MEEFQENHFKLPDELRSTLGKPMGKLVEGSIEKTTRLLYDELVPHDYLLVGVGDVTAGLFVDNGFNPDIIITDGQTKRTALEEWREFEGFTVLESHNPAAEITSDTWKCLVKAIELAKDQPVHVKIHGEEDLLVLPLLVELPNGSKIVYGQPNTGAVIRTVDNEARKYASDILKKMKI